MRYRSHFSFLAGAMTGVLAMAMAGAGQGTPPVPTVAHASQADTRPSGRFGPYPAEILRVIDGDTVEARISVWPGQHVMTKVRLRGIDTPEPRARCVAERILAEQAAQALAALIEPGSVTIDGVGPDKYFGRVIADLVLPGGRDAASTLVSQGLARPYAGRTRQGWCG